MLSSLTTCHTETESENDKRTAELQKLRDQLEQLQNHQSEDSRDISRQQKNTERYHAKRQMLSNRKDECNRNIRDLGVLPEEAFEKYINDKLERVCIVPSRCSSFLISFPAREEAACRE
jgi:structural maintenance of chromosome 3 (chondroitin sulfate proteoglycan 6)